MSNASQNFKDLIIWQKAHQFVLKVYRYTSLFPKEEIYGLTSQFRRASVSVAANIAEGFKRKGKRDKLKYYNYSQASLEESSYYCLLASDLAYGNSDQLQSMADELGKILRSYMKSIERSID